jgi:putative toxin-antitoxin system antitoxin component (TIGR02293 family)
MERTRARESQISKKFLTDIFSDKDWIAVYHSLQEGIERNAFSSATVESFLELALETEEVRLSLRRLLVSERSWKRREGGKTALSAAEVSRIASVGRVLREARRLWPEPGHATAEKFLITPHPRLHGETPLKVAASDGGLPAVLELLERVEEGAPV